MKFNAKQIRRRKRSIKFKRNSNTDSYAVTRYYAFHSPLDLTVHDGAWYCIVMLPGIWCRYVVNWASSWDYGTYHIGDQRRLRRACASGAVSQEPMLFAHIKYGSRRGPIKNQTSSPTGWLRMRVWRMSLRRTKSAIISWAGSITLWWRCWQLQCVLSFAKNFSLF